VKEVTKPVVNEVLVYKKVEVPKEVVREWAWVTPYGQPDPRAYGPPIQAPPPAYAPPAYAPSPYGPPIHAPPYPAYQVAPARSYYTGVTYAAPIYSPAYTPYSPTYHASPRTSRARLGSAPPLRRLPASEYGGRYPVSLRHDVCVPLPLEGPPLLHETVSRMQGYAWGLRAVGRASVGSQTTPNETHAAKREWEPISRALPFLRDETSWKKRDSLFVQFDRNKNGVLTFKEVEDGILSQLIRLPGNAWLHFDPKPVIVQAFRAACDILPHGRTERGKATVDRGEFRVLLANMRYYLEVYDWAEFLSNVPFLRELGARVENGQRAWESLDTDGSGHADFAEFLAWCLRNKLDDTSDDDKDYFRRVDARPDWHKRYTSKKRI